MNNYAKRILTILLTVTVLQIFHPQPIFAAMHNQSHDSTTESVQEIQPWAYYGVTCIACGRDDCMKYLYTEQAGIGGTTYIMYYLCTNCNGITTVTLHAR